MTSPPARQPCLQTPTGWRRGRWRTWRAGISVFLLCACGPDHDGARFAWESPRLEIGMLPGPEEDWMTPEVLDTSALHVLMGLAELGLPLWTMTDTTRGARVELRAEPWVCVGAYGGPVGVATCEGQQFDFKLRVAKQRCVWSTAFMHELTHLLLDVAAGDPDAQHAWKEAWAPSGDLLGPCQAESQKPAGDVVGR
jgi:hypothetical protein